MKRLPIAIQTFSEIRSYDYIYIDKTEHIYRMLNSSKAVFLSRPRRFGKSMTVSTIKSLYTGEKQYFGGLWIEDKWDWTRRNPVVHLQFARADYKNFDLTESLKVMLATAAQEFDVVLELGSPGLQFDELIRKLYATQGRVVILIDEYDKPIIDFLGKENREIAKKNREILRSFYSIIKDADPYIEFFFMTGVSKFSQTGIFSHLNHLLDITTHRNFTDLVGYTQTELESHFGEWISDIFPGFPHFSKADLLEQIKIWYNGYSWDGLGSVYNPYSILLFLSNARFDEYWFKTGTPTFLIDLIKEYRDFNFNALITNAALVSSYDLENLDLRTILFQTGYLTIKQYNPMNGDCVLDYPNREVEQAMANYIIAAMTGRMPTEVTAPIHQLRAAFQNNALEKVVMVINSMLKGVPSELLKGKKEDFYHSLVHLLFRYVGMEMDSEVHTSDGRMDAVVKTNSHIFILEFKINQSADVALQQIKEKNYPAPFQTDPRKLVLMGINFYTRRRSINEWKVE